MEEVWYPDSEYALGMHEHLVEMFASGHDPIVPPGVRDMNLLESALTRPQTSLGGVDKYRSVEQKAAALLYSMIKNHAFHNGNKRTALVTAIGFLSRNDRVFVQTVSDDDVYETVRAIAANEFPGPVAAIGADAVVDAIGVWLRDRTFARQSEVGSMKIQAFLDACAAAGATWKESGGSYVVAHDKHSLRIGRDTRQLDGPVVKRYLSKLGLSEGRTGIPIDEFGQGLSTEQDEIRRFRNVLTRLADA